MSQTVVILDIDDVYAGRWFKVFWATEVRARQRGIITVDAKVGSTVATVAGESWWMPAARQQSSVLVVTGGGDVWVEVVPVHDLDRYLDEWEELASNSLEPNPFFEAWQLRPALEAYGGDRGTGLRFV